MRDTVPPGLWMMSALKGTPLVIRVTRFSCLVMKRRILLVRKMMRERTVRKRTLLVKDLMQNREKGMSLSLRNKGSPLMRKGCGLMTVTMRTFSNSCRHSRHLLMKQVS